MGVDNTVISEVKPVGRIFETTRENSADGHTQNKPSKCDETKSSSKLKSKFMTINTLIAHGEVGDEIKQVKWLIFLLTR